MEYIARKWCYYVGYRPNGCIVLYNITKANKNISKYVFRPYQYVRFRRCHRATAASLLRP